MAAGIEQKALKNLVTAIDSRSFDPDFFAMMMNGQPNHVQIAYFNLFMRSMHAWAQNSEMGDDNPLFAVVNYARRFAEDLPHEIENP